MTAQHKAYRFIPRPAINRGWSVEEWASIIEAAAVASDPNQSRTVRFREASYVRRCALEAERARECGYHLHYPFKVEARESRLSRSHPIGRAMFATQAEAEAFAEGTGLPVLPSQPGDREFA